jgi:hypothetical protein
VRRSETCRLPHARATPGSQVGVSRCANEVEVRGAHREASSCKLPV